GANRLPYGEVRGTKVLSTRVSCAEFVYRHGVEFEKNGRSNTLGAGAGQHYEPVPHIDDFPINVGKESVRLRRNSVATTGFNMQTIEFLNALPRIADCD